MLGIRQNAASLANRREPPKEAKKTSGSLYYDHLVANAGNNFASGGLGTSSSSTATSRFVSSHPVPKLFPTSVLAAARGSGKEELDDSEVLVAVQQHSDRLKAFEGRKRAKLGRYLPEGTRAKTYCGLHASIFPRNESNAPVPPSESVEAVATPSGAAIGEHAQWSSVAAARGLGTKASLLNPDSLNEVESLLLENWCVDLRQLLSEIDSLGTKRRCEKEAELDFLLHVRGKNYFNEEGPKMSAPAEEVDASGGRALRIEGECVLAALKMDLLLRKFYEGLEAAEEYRLQAEARAAEAAALQEAQAAAEAERRRMEEEKKKERQRKIDAGEEVTEEEQEAGAGAAGENAAEDGDADGETGPPAVDAATEPEEEEGPPCVVSTADVSGLVSAMQTAYKYREDSPYLAAQIHQRGFEIAKKWAADIPDDDLRLDVMLGLDQKGFSVLGYKALESHALDPVLSPNLCSYGATALARINPEVLIQLLTERSTEPETVRLYRNLFFHGIKALKDVVVFLTSDRSTDEAAHSMEANWIYEEGNGVVDPSDGVTVLGKNVTINAGSRPGSGSGRSGGGLLATGAPPGAPGGATGDGGAPALAKKTTVGQLRELVAGLRGCHHPSLDMIDGALLLEVQILEKTLAGI